MTATLQVTAIKIILMIDEYSFDKAPFIDLLGLRQAFPKFFSGSFLCITAT